MIRRSTYKCGLSGMFKCRDLFNFFLKETETPDIYNTTLKTPNTENQKKKKKRKTPKKNTKTKQKKNQTPKKKNTRLNPSPVANSFPFLILKKKK